MHARDSANQLTQLITLQSEKMTMHTFIDSIKRKSRASFKSERPPHSSKPERSDSSTGGSYDLVTPKSKSETTLNSSSPDSTTPPSTSPPLISDQKNGHARSRPPQTSASSRYSMAGMTGIGSPVLSIPQSPYAPRIHNIKDGAPVFQKFALVSGMIGDHSTAPIDGSLTISRLDEQFPPQNFPVHDSYFKALVFLVPGVNRLRFDFVSPKLSNGKTSNPVHSTFITLNMIPMTNSPPLHLVILQAKDSAGTFDAPPPKIENEGNGLETAIKKYRMAGYLWQAFTAEQMDRARMGRRVFRLEEEWQTGTSSSEDAAKAIMRSEAKVHVVKCDRTVAELRDLDLAQQNPEAQRKTGLYDIALGAVRDHFNPSPGQTVYAAVLLLDSHWDKEAKVITGHAALGGGTEQIKLAIFGSHALHSYPTCIEEVVPVFTDCTPTDTEHVGNDCNDSGSNWENACMGIGAHLHEVGHLFGSPHQAYGVMLRDYTSLNRTFTTREPYSTRTQSKGGVVLRKDECSWHRLDTLRFRDHPCFRMPHDPPRASDASVQVWPVENGKIIITATSGLSFAEIYADSDEMCQHWMEFGDGRPDKPNPKQVCLTESAIRSRLPEEKKKARLKLQIKSVGGGNQEIEDFCLLSSKASTLKLSNGHVAFPSYKIGFSQLEGSEKHEVILESSLHPTRVLTQVKVYHDGFGLDGIEFVYENSTSQLFGKRGGTLGGSTFNLDVRRTEQILGFNIRGGAWIDGIQILTTHGRKSEFYGNASGGSGHVLVPPSPYKICGISGSCGQWVDGFSLIITR